MIGFYENLSGWGEKEWNVLEIHSIFISQDKGIKGGEEPCSSHLLFDAGQWRGLQCRQFDEFVYGCTQPVGILAAGCGKVGLSAAAA